MCPTRSCSSTSTPRWLLHLYNICGFGRISSCVFLLQYHALGDVAQMAWTHPLMQGTFVLDGFLQASAYQARMHSHNSQVMCGCPYTLHCGGIFWTFLLSGSATHEPLPCCYLGIFTHSLTPPRPAGPAHPEPRGAGARRAAPAEPRRRAALLHRLGLWRRGGVPVSPELDLVASHPLPCLALSAVRCCATVVVRPVIAQAPPAVVCRVA